MGGNPSKTSPAAIVQAERKDETRKIGRGFVFILFAKGYFMVMGFAVQFGLPRLFQRAAATAIAAGRYSGLGVSRVAEMLYGDYGISVRTVSWINNTMVQGTIQAVSKYVAEDEKRAHLVKATAMRVQAFIGLGLALAYFLLADVGASILGDPSLGRYFRITAIIILAYSLYAVLIGYLNGVKKFSSQAAFDVTYSSMRTVFMLGAAALGFGVAEVLWGFSGAAIIICLLAAVTVGVGIPKGLKTEDLGSFSSKALFRGMALVILYFIVFNFLLAADLWIVKAVAGRISGVDPEQAAQLSSALTGLYTGVQAIALVPYQAVLAVAFVIFPVISKSTFDNDHQGTRDYVANTLRYGLIFVVMVAVTLGASSANILTLVKPSFAVAAPALRAYLSGEVFFALFAVANTIIIASGRMKTAIALACITLALDMGANLIVFPRYLSLVTAADGSMYLDPAGLTASALATAASFLCGFLLSQLVLWRIFRAKMPLTTILRVGLAALIAGTVGHQVVSVLPLPGPIVAMAGSGIAALVYGVVLLLSKEFKEADKARLMKVISKKK